MLWFYKRITQSCLNQYQSLLSVKHLLSMKHSLCFILRRMLQLGYMTKKQATTKSIHELVAKKATALRYF